MKLWPRSDGTGQSPLWSWLLVTMLMVFAVAPLTYPGFFEAHSGFLPAFNAEHISEAPHWGRAVDPVRGEGRLPYLLVWPFFELSSTGVVAIKWGYGLAFLLGALGIYLWTRRWLGAKGSVLAAVVYTYLPWHLTTVYVRGAYAEAWLWAFWPFLLWALDRLNERRRRNILEAVVVGVPVLIAMLWTQPGLAILFLPFLAAYGTILVNGYPRPVLGVIGAVGLSLLLVWVVAQRVPGAGFPLADRFLHPFQLFSAAWGNGPSFQLGIAAIGMTMVAVALWVSRRTAEAQGAEAIGGTTESLSASSLSPGRALWFWLIALLLILFFTLTPSSFLWQIAGFDALLTHPWQLLALAGLPLAFLASLVLRLDERLTSLPAWSGLVALVVLASYPYLAPRLTQVDPGPEPVALFEPVGADAPQIVLLDNEISLGAEITPTLSLTLTWQTVGAVVDDYTVFVHVLAEDNTKVAQQDTRPCDGECPTNTWQPGEIVVDRHQLTVAPDAPLGPYRLAVGLYLLDSGERAGVLGRDDGMVILHVP